MTPLTLVVQKLFKILTIYESGGQTVLDSLIKKSKINGIPHENISNSMPLLTSDGSPAHLQELFGIK